MLTKIIGTDDRNVVQTLFDYLFRRINKYEYRAAMPSREEAKATWAAVQQSGYILLNCKLYLYARHVAKSEGRRVRALDFEIHPDDIRILNRVELVTRTIYPALGLKEFTDIEKAILTSREIDLDGHMGRFINRKLKFLCRSYGLTMSGIKALFIETALYAVRKQYPFFESHLHMVNVCKTAIHNCGQSTISYWTRQKRNALIREDDGTFSAVHVDVAVSQSVQQLSCLDAKDDPHYHTLEALRACGNGLQPKARKFIQLAQGAFDSGFSLFLGENNEDAAHTWGYDRYLAGVRNYLHVTESQMQRLLAHMRRRL